MKGVLILCLSILLVGVAFSQPFINSVDPISAGFDETVSISGSGFSNTTSENIIFLGSGRVTEIVSASNNLLVVKVPANATSGAITVTNISNNLSSQFQTNFIYQYGSTNSFSTERFRVQDDIATNEFQTYDICSCDFNLDGLNDLVVTNNEAPVDSDERTELLLYLNTSTLSSTSFATPTRLGDRPTIKVVCGDLNGDGAPDIIATEGANQNNEVFIFQNSGAGVFSTSPDLILQLPRDEAGNLRSPETLEIADLDGDGFLDIVVGNTSNNEIDLFRNLTNTGGNISFSTDVSNVFQITIPGTNREVRGLALADLNGDNTPEIIVSELSDTQIFVLRNTSRSGLFSFDSPTTISSPNAQFRNLEVGDLNGDGLMDIAATDVSLGSTSGNIVLVQNTTNTTGGTPTFSSPVTIGTLQNAWGLSLGDIDGDGDLDIAVASESQSSGDILLNGGATTIAESNFTNNTYALNFNSRNIGMADMNGDSKTDLFFTSNSLTGQNGFLSVKVNTNCVIPSIAPNSGTYCNGDGTTILATNINNASYSWSVNSATASSTTNALDISTNSADLTVTVTLNTTHDGCSQTSSSASYNNSTVATATPTLSLSTSPVCANSTLSLTTTATASSYLWTGPNGLDTTTTIGTLSIANATSEANGIYRLRTQETAASCFSAPDSLTVEVFSVPTLTVLNENADVFCEGGSTTLNSRLISGFSYQWQRNSSDLEGENSNTTTADSSGEFALRLTDTNGCSATSVPLTLQEVIAPTATISGDDEICVDVALALSSTSFGENNFDLNYQWKISSISTGSELVNSTDSTTSFSSAISGLYLAQLTAEYATVPGCNGTVQDTITVSDVPTVPIITPDGIEKCPSDSLRIEMPEGYSSYTWVDITDGRTDTLSQYENSNVAFATTAEGESATTIEVTGITPISCTVTSSREIRDFLNSGVNISSSTFDIVDNTITIPPQTNGIELFAEGGSDYLWQPTSIFSDSTSAIVTAFPRTADQEITLTGTDANDCRESQTILLQNENLLARKGFSPNGDGQGFECWEILNSSTISGCQVIIFDSRGRNIVNAESPFENDCVWDGTSGGTQMPIGIYYYVIKCQDSSLDQSGSILLAR